MNLLEVRDLVKVFDQGEHPNPVLNHLSFDLAEGECLAIMGSSGSGKSTLLYCVSGMDQISEGHLYFNGHELSDLSQDQLADIRLHEMGFVFQHNHLIKTLTLFDNICLPARLAGNPLQQVKERALELMERMGIAEVKDHVISQVSGGQLQRAAICRALINRPAILFADEPTGALNSSHSQQVMAIFNELKQEGMTQLIVTHDPQVAAQTDRIIYLKDGRIEDQLRLDEHQGLEHTQAWLMDRGF